jgi:hypothetical protein
VPQRQDAGVDRQQRFELPARRRGSVGVTIGDLVVDLRQPDRSVVAEMRDDDPRGLEAQDSGPCIGRMPHQVDQKIEIVCGDGVGCGAVVERGEIDELVDGIPPLGSHGVGVFRRRQRIRANFEAVSIMCGDHRQQKLTHHVIAKIGRKIADAPHGIAIAARPRQRRHTALSCLLEPIVGAINGKQPLLRHVDVLQQRQQFGDELLVALGVRPVECAFERNRFAHGVAAAHARGECRDREAGGWRRDNFEAFEVLGGLLIARQAQEQPAQLEPDLLVSGRELARTQKMRHRETPAFRSDQRLRGVVACVEARRRACHRRFERTRGFLVAPAREQHVATREPRLRPIGTSLRRGGERLQRFAVVMLLGQQDAKIMVELRALGRNLERFSICGNRAIAIARRDVLVRRTQQSFEFARHRPALTQPRSRA